ncbi:hypothetical protein L249_2607 [Ophiocordyceps polyrhachis-furcata BCC 54312]|uniref:Leucine-rich repeat-containing protein 40 n=1 Tax=Ophiocordyceps polyrhachis-furcata BCC 54312 TaxID=1330021 RepID=A0A367LPM9_9HYPO|nr:hypothetical protein L249_2607 [Ophiocordyceps polyrhachis-furcata BCC 54312]
MEPVNIQSCNGLLRLPSSRFPPSNKARAAIGWTQNDGAFSDMDGPRDRPVPRISRLPVARPKPAVPNDASPCELQPRKLRHASSLSSCATPTATGSRPSLSQRTIDTLSQLPSSPAMTKKPSSFYDQRRPPSGTETTRPRSSHNSDSSARGSSRPGSRLGSDDCSLRPPAEGLKGSLATASTPRRRSHFGHTTPRSAVPPRRASVASPSRLPSAAAKKALETSPPAKTVAKTQAVRPAAPKLKADGLFRKPSLPAVGPIAGKPNHPRRPPPRDSQAQVAARNGAISPTRFAPQKSGEASSLRGARSSAALREHIAKAKAASRVAAKHANDAAPSVTSRGAFDPDASYDDPFNLQKGQDANAEVLKQRLSAARCSGRLNISALCLKEIPAQVVHMYDLENMGALDGSWAESVDLRRLVAADNEISTLDDDLLPDVDPAVLAEEADSPGGIFWGLETLDLHGNILSSVPLGFRRLLHLTTLNLSSNQLGNDCLDIIAQIPGLKDLSLAKNRLSGPLDPVLCRIGSLEALDLHGNSISALPVDMEDLLHLRTLNVNENHLASLSFDGLAKLPLTQLLVRKNKLSGTLIREPVHSLPLLQTLDASANQLTHLVPTGAVVGLPVMNAVSLSMNRLEELPDMTTWTNLVTLAVDENNISTVPDSFTGLGRLRHADFSNNHIRFVPPEIARMVELTTIWLRGNPLVDRKFATMSTDQLKDTLAARLEPPPPYQEAGEGQPRTERPAEKPTGAPETGDWDSRSDADDDFATPPTSAPHSPTRTPSATSSSPSRTAEAWPVKSGGLLDRAHTGLTDLDEAACLEVANRHRVREAQLHHNQLALIPVAVRAFGVTLVSLSLAHNQLTGSSYLTKELELASLTEINLASNAMTDLEPLTRFLRAPALDKMDVSRNRVKALPGNLKSAFPQLTVLLASNNQLAELEPEWIRGLKVVDVSSNEIAQLKPRIGLLGGRGGLQKLELSGNRFRVPRWTTLERGTEATLRWLRGRMPAEEMALWREENGVDSDEELE